MTFQMIPTMNPGHYVDRRGCRYEVGKVSRWNDHLAGYVTMSNPATGHGWGGEMSATTWVALCDRENMRAR